MYIYIYIIFCSKCNYQIQNLTIYGSQNMILVIHGICTRWWKHTTLHIFLLQSLALMVMFWFGLNAFAQTNWHNVQFRTNNEGWKSIRSKSKLVQTLSKAHLQHLFISDDSNPLTAMFGTHSVDFPSCSSMALILQKVFQVSVSDQMSKW